MKNTLHLTKLLWVVFAGYLIPQGWCVLASFISVHMDEENYENPYRFDPWRWEVALNNLSLLDIFLNNCTTSQDKMYTWIWLICISKSNSKMFRYLLISNPKSTFDYQIKCKNLYPWTIEQIKEFVCLQKLGAALNNNSFTPFGGGQRLCPGLELSRLEISIFLHYLITSYR